MTDSVTLVTGGSGYLGETLVKKLAARGDRVRVLDLVDNEDRPASVEFARGDIRDESAVRRALADVHIVHHNVAQVPLAKDREQFWSVNVEGTRTLLDLAHSMGVKKTILVSSSAVYGVPPRNPVDGSVSPYPREAYGAAKLAAERVGQEYVGRGLDVSIVRPRTILGHGRLGIFQILFEWVRRGRPIYTLGDGSNRYQFVHADDLAEICLRADKLPGFRVLRAGAGRFGTMRELLDGLVAHAGTGSPIRALPFGPTQLAMAVTSKLGLSPLGDYHTLMYGREMYFDMSETESALGFVPHYSNAEMIAESYDWYVAHRDEVLARKDASHHRSPVRLGVLKLLELLP
ncbi:MAG TPA: NAD-dependent epimerase/dehydratase family protein [Polyangiaceae bacterium]|jgi:nucleoside-diphosphate-sugar epimerase|nr:NAD-dependent epimerase/dehydratase family protein [Polyangiaceae bacterium]